MPAIGVLQQPARLSLPRLRQVGSIEAADPEQDRNTTKALGPVWSITSLIAGDLCHCCVVPQTKGRGLPAAQGSIRLTLSLGVTGGIEATHHAPEEQALPPLRRLRAPIPGGPRPLAHLRHRRVEIPLEPIATSPAQAAGSETFASLRTRPPPTAIGPPSCPPRTKLSRTSGACRVFEHERPRNARSRGK